MLWILETTKLNIYIYIYIYIYKHASSLQEKHKEKKRVIGNNHLHGALRERGCFRVQRNLCNYL